MATPLSLPTICHLCNKPVTLELARADEKGRTVHEGCFFLKVGKVN
jgi:hypothetical protein